MSTIATKFSAASMQFKVGTAAVALVAAAAITPAMAQAAPDIAPISSVDVYEVSDLVVVPGGLNAKASEGAAASAAGVGAAASAFNPIVVIGGVIHNVVKAVATLVYNGAQFVVSGLQWAANEFARVFRVGPYAEVG